ncbi:MAG: tetratricopeptide repeat protein [Thermaceae bacterium]
MRALALAFLLALMGSTLSQGLVLPFEGPEGYRTAQGYAQALNTLPPSAAALLLPNPPWGSYDRTGGLYSRAGAVLAREITGAEFVLLGRTQPFTLYLATREGVYEGRFPKPEVAWLWLKARLGRHGSSLPPEPTGDEDHLRALASGEEVDELHAQAQRLRRGEAIPLTGVPQRLSELWQGKLPPVYALYGFLAEGKSEEALKLAQRLQEGGVLDQLGALFALHHLKDSSWKALAWRLTEEAPYLAVAWEMASYAAFEEEDGARAKEALLEALKLSPDSALYWTNLGWAEYLLGQRARALLATKRALRLEESPTPLYNLGFLNALYGNHLGARSAYNRALRLDEEDEVNTAVEDWAKYEPNTPQGLFWRAYLLERAGRFGEAQALYRAFLEANPQSPLSPMAQRALQRLQNAQAELRVERLTLIPKDLEARPFRAGEAIFPEVELLGTPYLEALPLTSRLLKEGKVIQEEEIPLVFPPLTAGLKTTAPAVTPQTEGRYTLEVAYGQRTVRIELEILRESLARKLYTLGLLPKDPSGQNLLSPKEMLGLEGDTLLLRRSLQVLREAAPLAQSPGLTTPLGQGPFRGKSVRQVLEDVNEDLLLAFYQAVLEDPSLLGETDLVSAFVSWILK